MEEPKEELVARLNKKLKTLSDRQAEQLKAAGDLVEQLMREKLQLEDHVKVLEAEKATLERIIVKAALERP